MVRGSILQVTTFTVGLRADSSSKMSSMLRTALAIGLAFSCSQHLYAQAAPEFEVATIKPAPPQAEGRTSTRMSSDTQTGRLNYNNVNLKEVIGQAYKVRQYQISGPSWMETERFDIVAKFQTAPAEDQIPRMLQALLAERFKLTMRRETKELPIFAVIVGKNGPKLEKSKIEEKDR